MKKLLVISPHPDDEVLGAGGILIKAKKNGFKTKVLTISTNFPEPIIKNRLELSLKEARQAHKILKVDESAMQFAETMIALSMFFMHNGRVDKGSLSTEIASCSSPPLTKNAILEVLKSGSGSPPLLRSASINIRELIPASPAAFQAAEGRASGPTRVQGPLPIASLKFQ